MLCEDAHSQGQTADSSFSNIKTITLDVVSRIEQELDPYDLASIVFLLYDVPDTALQRLIIFQRVSRDIASNLLKDWAQHTQLRPTWRYEFVEALAICQVYNVIRKIGLNVSTVKKHYLPNNIHTSVYINPMKKALYKICETITSENLVRLQNTLKTQHDIDTSEYKMCELVFLELMCKKFITVGDHNNKNADNVFQVENLAKIIQNFSGLQKYASELRDIERRFTNEPKKTSPSTSSTAIKDTIGNEDECEDDIFFSKDFEDVFGMICKSMKEVTLQSDNKKLVGAYPIKNPKRVGVCYIINQEDFHPSKDSIEGIARSSMIDLEKRNGSTRDQKVLEKTMTDLKFEVISHRNLNHTKMLEYIKNIIENRVHYDDSMFMLCILSHGVSGHVYAADSVKVKVEDIHKLMDDTFAQRKMHIPKIMIIQACQVSDDEHKIKLAADGPPEYNLKKSDFLTCWATARELKAYREEKKGSIFIQTLCYMMKYFANKEHLKDILTIVTDVVITICKIVDRNQVPLIESTLRRKIYLQIPE